MTTVLKFFTITFLVLIFLSCSKKETNTPTDLSTPKVLTDSVGVITEISASCYITISSEGKGPISEAGIVWSLNTNPTTASNKLLAANKINGSYNISLTGLAENTDYFVRAFATNEAGTNYSIQVQFNTESINNIKLLLTGGSRITWKLDPAPGAAAVTAGTETNPTEFYAGGPLAPCQINDSYTFTINDSIYANFSGDALINDAPASYYCSGYGNFSGTFSFGPVVGSGAGFAQIVLTTPGKQFEGLTLDKQFIGIMDNVQNVYRILEISSTKMVLRVGDGSGFVQTLKFVPK